MNPPDDRKYAESHEWHKLDGDILTLGVSKFAVDELTDITYVEMQPVGTDIEPGESVGEIESVKATADVYSAIGGKIIQVNTNLDDDPSALNTDPFGDGWLIKIKVTDTAPMDSLMDAATYASAHQSS
jgi:glycine cleavage system H protein